MAIDIQFQSNPSVHVVSDWLGVLIQSNIQYGSPSKMTFIYKLNILQKINTIHSNRSINYQHSNIKTVIKQFQSSEVDIYLILTS